MDILLYADGIDKNTTPVTLYHYIDALLKLKDLRGPVIAGRLNSLGLGLISLGLAGFPQVQQGLKVLAKNYTKMGTQGFNLYEGIISLSC